MGHYLNHVSRVLKMKSSKSTKYLATKGSSNVFSTASQRNSLENESNCALGALFHLQLWIDIECSRGSRVTSDSNKHPY